MTEEVTVRTVPSANIGAAELYALTAGGYEPVKVVFAVSAQSMGARGFGRTISAIFTKGEMQTMSQTAKIAREVALARVEEQAAALGGDLVLTTFETRDLGEIVEVTCVGTILKMTGRGFVPMPMATAAN